MLPQRTYNPDIGQFPKWKRVVDEATLPDAPWLERRTILSEARAVNKEINEKFKYIPDAAHDHWKLPEEFEADGGGDCEDYAIYKMFSLYARGLAKHDIEIGIGFLPSTRICHAVLLVHDDDHATAMLSCPFEYQATNGLGYWERRRFPGGVIRLSNEPFFDQYIKFAFFINHEGWRTPDAEQPPLHLSR